MDVQLLGLSEAVADVAPFLDAPVQLLLQEESDTQHVRLGFPPEQS